MKLYVIEGNIGVGKSTAISRIRDHGYTVIPEPVDRWIASGALEGYYRGEVDPFTFQCHILQTKAEGLRSVLSRAKATDTIVMERGFIADADVFLRHNVDEGLVSELQLDIYRDISRSLVGDVKVDGVVYMEAAPATCAERVKGRARAGEDAISVDLLEKINGYYEKVISRESNVLRVDAESDFEFGAIDEFFKRS